MRESKQPLGERHRHTQTDTDTHRYTHRQTDRQTDTHTHTHRHHHACLCPQTDTPSELKEVRQWLRDCYEAITCYLLPHPGKLVTKSKFSGNLDELESDFREHFVNFVADILRVRVQASKRTATNRYGH